MGITSQLVTRRTCHWKWSIFRIHAGTGNATSKCHAPSSRVYQERRNLGEKLEWKPTLEGVHKGMTLENKIRTNVKLSMNIKYKEINAMKVRFGLELTGVSELDIRIKYLRIQLNPMSSIKYLRM